MVVSYGVFTVMRLRISVNHGVLDRNVSRTCLLIADLL